MLASSVTPVTTLPNRYMKWLSLYFALYFNDVACQQLQLRVTICRICVQILLAFYGTRPASIEDNRSNRADMLIVKSFIEPNTIFYHL